MSLAPRPSPLAPAESGLTLREYFETIYAPMFLRGAKPRTLKEFFVTIGYWERLSGDPPLSKINSLAVANFLAALDSPLASRTSTPSQQLWLAGFDPPASKMRKLKRGTINKHHRHVSALMSKLGPPCPRNWEALGILNCVPAAPWLKQPRPAPRSIDDGLLAAVYRGAEAAELPRLPSCSAGDWWRGLIVAGVTLAFRREALMALRWEWIDWAGPAVRLPAEFDKMGVERKKPLIPVLVRRLLKIRGSDPKVFPWPLGESSFYRQWHAIQDCGGIPRAEQIKLHDLKRAGGTRLAEIGSPWEVQAFMDHASLATSRHYINAAESLRAKVSAMRLPECFSE